MNFLGASAAKNHGHVGYLLVSISVDGKLNLALSRKKFRLEQCARKHLLDQSYLRENSSSESVR